jgi:hypothetical protein
MCPVEWNGDIRLYVPAYTGFNSPMLPSFVYGRELAEVLEFRRGTGC